MKQTFDVVIIGGGAFGFFSAIQCKINHPSLNIIILEQSKEVLNKVKISGGGRCNVTNSIWDAKDLSKNYPRGERELLGPFTKFGCGDTIAWFEEHGVPLKIENDGRVFPQSDDSSSIVDCLLRMANLLDIIIQCQSKVKEIIFHENNYDVITDVKIYTSTKLVIATGSSQYMWNILHNNGYNIIDPVASLFTFNTKDPRLSGLMGLSLPHVEIAIEGTTLQSEGPILVTHWGLSGPAILKLSAWGARILHDLSYQFKIVIDWLPNVSHEQIKQIKNNFGAKSILSNPLDKMPSRLWKGLLIHCSINDTTKWADINKETLETIIEALKNCQFCIYGKSTFKEEFVTAGGVTLKQINFITFESKFHKGLYFGGEVLDIDAITGGFNFQAAWTAGYLVGKAIGQSYKEI